MVDCLAGWVNTSTRPHTRGGAGAREPMEKDPALEDGPGDVLPPGQQEIKQMRLDEAPPSFSARRMPCQPTLCMRL
jgi:hypothetical protein